MKKADIQAALAAGEDTFVVKRSRLSPAWRAVRVLLPNSTTSDGDVTGHIEPWSETSPDWAFHYETLNGGTAKRCVESRAIICTLAQYEERQREAEATKDERKRLQEFRDALDAAAANTPEALALIAEYEAMEAECADWFNRASVTLANEAKIVASNAPAGGSTHVLDTCHRQTKTAYTALTTSRSVLDALRRGGIPHVVLMILSGAIDPTDENNKRAVEVADQWVKQIIYAEGDTE